MYLGTWYLDGMLHRRVPRSRFGQHRCSPYSGSRSDDEAASQTNRVGGRRGHISRKYVNTTEPSRRRAMVVVRVMTSSSIHAWQVPLRSSIYVNSWPPLSLTRDATSLGRMICFAAAAAAAGVLHTDKSCTIHPPRCTVSYWLHVAYSSTDGGMCLTYCRYR